MASTVFAGLPKEKQESIVSSALKEFSAQSYDRVSVFQIAKGAGISRAAFYSYFNDKEDIYRHIIGSMFKAFWDSVLADGGVGITDLPLTIFDFYYRFKFTKTQDFITRLTENAQPAVVEQFLSCLSFNGEPDYITQESLLRSRINSKTEFTDVTTSMALAAIYSLREYYHSDLDPRDVRERLERKTHYLNFGIVD